MNTDTFISYNEDIIRNMTQYFPTDEYLFLASVSSKWKQCYLESNTEKTSYKSVLKSNKRMQVFLDENPRMFQILCDRACIYKNVSSIRWLCSPQNYIKYKCMGPSLCYAAAGGEEILDFIMDKFRYSHSNPYNIEQINWGAIYSGDLYLLNKYNNYSNKLWKEGYVKLAISRNKLDVLKWAHEHKKINHDTFLFNHMGGFPDLDMVNWCIDKLLINGINIMSEDAALHGNLDLLKLLNRRHIVFSNDNVLYNRAARRGHIHVMTWLSSIGYTVGVESYIAASSASKHTSTENIINCLNFIEREIGTSSVSWIFETIEHTAKYHNTPVEVLEWLRERV